MALDWPNLGVGAVIGAVLSYGVGLLTNSTSDRLKFWKAKKDNQIQITSPRPGEVLHDSKQLPPGVCYRVTGRLGFLPHDHRVWLMVQPRRVKGFWPQGFEPVTYNPVTGDWSGFVFEPSGKAKVTIIAVVAPPSAQAFFEYYQRHGNSTNWDPLNEIPAECTNRHQVDTETP